MQTDPIERFSELYAQAHRRVAKDANAMVVACVDERGRPSSRVVLLKDFDQRGFVFYTNLQSRKGRELLAQPFASLCFYWPELEQQVRIEGAVQQVTDQEADAYFATRPRMSQIGAWASEQSQPLRARAELEKRVAEFEARYAGQLVPRPPHWSGFRVVPDRIEFWVGRENRLHDRWSYTRTDGGWKVELLNP